MSHAYRSVQWNPQKRRYDLALWLGIALFLGSFIGGALWRDANADGMTLAIRGTAVAAFLLLTLILSIGPLARFDRRFLPLLYNRRHLGVSMFVLASVHVALVLLQFHAQGTVNPLVSLLAAGAPRAPGSPFPFELLGLAAWVVLLLMAATSHDFWLANLHPPLWKALHMLVYLAYAALLFHIALGTLQQERSPVYATLLVGAGIWVFGLHALAGWRERRGDVAQRGDPADGYVDAGRALDIPDGRAVTVTAGGERVAIFRDGARLCALSAVCRHQNGPLGEGRIVDGLITCPWHGYQYRPEDGCSPPPFTDKVATYRLKIRDGRVWLDPTPLPPGTPVPPAQLGHSGALS
jgi:nitrite reductase/ring-hydroxylating ferredoxin subunit/DMSO/TMAO reductase YedYZ heme-binding membrane subunit